MFGTAPNETTSTVPVSVADGGGIENIPFLDANARSALIYSTSWISAVSHPDRRPFLQLQHAQVALLSFPILLASPPAPFSWPHVSVTALHKDFG